MDALQTATAARLRPVAGIRQGAIMAQHPRSFRLSADGADRLDQLARARFGANATAAVEAALELAALVYLDPATVTALDPAAALAAYVRARCEEAA